MARANCQRCKEVITGADGQDVARNFQRHRCPRAAAAAEDTAGSGCGSTVAVLVAIAAAAVTGAAIARREG